MRCPDCQKTLMPKQQECSCGWTRPSGPPPTMPSLGYQQCEWEADHERCRYPGSMSTNTRDGGPRYCRYHFACGDPVYGAQIVEASRDYKHATEEEFITEHTARAKAYLAERGLERQAGESFAAWRQRTLDWMREKSAFKRFEDAEAA